VIERLTRGEPFECDGQGVEQIPGLPITKDGLLSLYQYASPPDTHAKIVNARARGTSKLVFEIFWVNDVGEDVGQLKRRIYFRDDGVHLYSSNVYLRPDYRGYATSAKVMLQEVAMLRAITSPGGRSAMRLTAGNMGGESLGPLVWALFGYDFPVGSREAERLRGKLRDWLEALQLPLNHEQRAALHEAVDSLQHPWEFAEFSIPGVQVKIPRRVGESVEVEVGEAFLLSGHEWSGEFRIDDLDSWGAQIGAASVKRAIGAANSRIISERTEEAGRLGGRA
jgi:hypothetical protein